jgi:hypothetical protein
MLALPAAALLGACARPVLPKPGPVKAGDQVRVTTTAPAARFAGRLVALGDSDLAVSLDPRRTARIPRRAVQRLEIDMGMERNAYLGSRVGALFGFVAGLGWGLSTPMRCRWGESGLFSFGTIECASDIGGRSGWVLMHAMFGGAAGGMVGGALGFLVRTDRWEAVPLDARLGATTLSGGRFGAGLSIGF